MIDPGPLPAAPAAVAPHDAHGGVSAGNSWQLVEERLRRLEDAVAALQERRAREPAPAEPVVVLRSTDAGGAPTAGPNDLLRETSRRLLPLAVGLLHGPSPEPGLAAPAR